MGLTPIRDSDIRSEHVTKVAEKLGGLVEFYRSPARVAWTPTAGILVSDRWSGYEWYDAGLHQVCWAHLTRDFQGFIDRGGKGGHWARS